MEFGQEGTWGHRIDILDEAGQCLGYLTPITQAMASDSLLIESLAQWRNLHRANFMTQFEATPARTKAWLEDCIANDPTRLMFMIANPEGTWIGHLGVMRLDQPEPELDNMIRGRTGGDSRLMFLAEVALLRWLFQDRKAEGVCLHVFTKNWIPISIHQSIGFRIVASYPLVSLEVNGEIQYKVGTADGNTAPFKYAKMVIQANAFQAFIDRFSKGIEA